MKKTITLFTILLFVVFMVGCENSINPIEPNNQDISLAKQSNPDEAVSTLAKGRQEKVEICHLTGNGKYVTISVAASAVQAHLDHGDMLTVLTGEWLFYMNYNPIPHYYDFVAGTVCYPYNPPAPYNVIEELSSNAISCDDGTLSFRSLYRV